MGYGYPGRIPEYPKGDFKAFGVYGQYTCVNPPKRVVIVKDSADPFRKAGRDINYAVAGLLSAYC